MRWLNYEAQMETDVFLYPPWFAALGGGILRDTTGAVRISMDSGEPRQQDDVLSDFRHGDCLCNRKCVLWQRAAEKIKNVPRGVGAPLRGLDNYSITE